MNQNIAYLRKPILALCIVTGGCGSFTTKNKEKKARENDNALVGE